jgi:hypothetical protein
MMRPCLAIWLTVVLTGLLDSNTLAWNGEAHQLVAWIAEERLSENAKAGVADLLDGAHLSDAEVASWADEIRRQRKNTAPWHYVNIPVDSDGYDAKRDGHDGANVIDAVERFEKVLADTKAPREDRVEALKFLVHFMGDLHQPLHCADRNGDKGGNKRLVFFLDRKEGREPSQRMGHAHSPDEQGQAERRGVRRRAERSDHGEAGEGVGEGHAAGVGDGIVASRARRRVRRCAGRW